MAAKAKTPAKVIELMQCQQDTIAYVTDALRVKRTVPVENQADWVRERSEDYFKGMARGANTMLESVLSKFNCYAGFSYFGTTLTVFKTASLSFYPSIGPDHPEYEDWRVVYAVRS